LNAWEAGEQRDLVSVNKSAAAEIVGNWSGSNSIASVTVDGWETEPTNYIQIYSTGSARHNGVWDDTKHFMHNGFIRQYEWFFIVDGLQWKNTDITTQYPSGLYDLGHPYNPSASILIKNCIIKSAVDYSGSQSTPAFFTYRFSGVGGGAFTIYNCIMYHATGSPSSRVFAITPQYALNYFNVYNCSFIDCNSIVGVTTNTYQYKNNLLHNCQFDIPFSTSYCATSNTTAAGMGDSGSNRYSQVFTFRDKEHQDYRLKSIDQGAKGYGTDLSSLFTTDIVGNYRTVPWDIGAANFVPPNNYFMYDLAADAVKPYYMIESASYGVLASVSNDGVLAVKGQLIEDTGYTKKMVLTRDGDMITRTFYEKV
jgi:hypothetical protein